jgi:hypothetical protein
MKKNLPKLAKFVLKHLEKKTPEQIFNEMVANPLLSFIPQTLSPKDVLTLCFITSMMANDEYVEGVELIIYNHLFSFSILSFEEISWSTACSICDGDGNVICHVCNGGGNVECDTCDGSGNETCPDCSGDGEDSEGELCGNCEGEGTLSCDECDGDGSSICQECDGKGDVKCDVCNGDGRENVDGYIPFTHLNYFAWNPKLRQEIKNKLDNQDQINLNSIPQEQVYRYRSDFFSHGDSDTLYIREKFQNGSYVGGLNENPTIAVHGKLWSPDPTDFEQFMD